MSELSKTLGSATHKATINGREITLQAFSIEDYAAFETLLEENAWAAVHRANVKRWVTSDQHERNIQACIKLIAAEKLAYGSDSYGEACQTLWGIKKWIRIGTKNTHPELTEEEISKLVDADTFNSAKAIMETDALSQ